MPNATTPVDGQPWPFADFMRDSPLWAPSGVVGAPAATYGAGDLGLSFDIVSGTSVTPKLQVGRGRCRGARYERTGAPWTSGMAGTVPYDGSAVYLLNTGSNPRRDRIVLRRDHGTQKVYPIILVGAPSASPSPVALTQVENGAWDTPLFSWTMPGGSSTTPTNVVDERVWIDPDGRNPERVATGATAIQQVVNPGGTYAFAGVNNRRSPYIGAYMRAEVSFLARFVNGDQQQTLGVQFGVTGGSTLENDHDMTERIPGGTGSGEDARAIKRTAFFVCTDAAFTVGYNTVLGTGGSSVVVQNPRCYVTGPFQLF